MLFIYLKWNVFAFFFVNRWRGFDTEIYIYSRWIKQRTHRIRDLLVYIIPRWAIGRCRWVVFFVVVVPILYNPPTSVTFSMIIKKSWTFFLRSLAFYRWGIHKGETQACTSARSPLHLLLLIQWSCQSLVSFLTLYFVLP